MSDVKICEVTDCGDAVHARGWCMKHYLRWYNHGSPTKVLRPYTYYSSTAADSDLVAEVMSVCEAKPARAERMARYFELRLDGQNEWESMVELNLAQATAHRYELWFEHFMANRRATEATA